MKPEHQSPDKPAGSPGLLSTGGNALQALSGEQDRASGIVGVCGFSPTARQPPERTPFELLDHTKGVKDDRHLSGDAIVLWVAEPLMYMCLLIGAVMMVF